MRHVLVNVVAGEPVTERNAETVMCQTATAALACTRQFDTCDNSLYM